MSTSVLLPPDEALRPDGTKSGGWWHRAADSDRIVCDLCPRECSLKPGDRGFCFVRQNVDDQMVLTTYGRSTGFCIDPIEKKPLNQFYPGTSVLSFGTAGCNLGCKFCQNWSISKSREIEQLSESATPEQVAKAAQALGCRSVAFTYNDPVIWAEYAIDTAKACHDVGIKTVAVTAGYITPAARGAFYEVMDAANVDLKGFTEGFYKYLTLSHLQPVLDTLRWLKHETNVWFEITNLVIPGENDSLDEIKQMSDWCYENLGPDVPLHFTAFHPDFRLRDRPHTPPETLMACYDIAKRSGLNYVYTGNIHDARHQSTYCPNCRAVLIERNWYVLGQYNLNGSHCGQCGHEIAGRFDTAPGNWGAKRQPVRISDYAPPVKQVIPIGALRMTESVATPTQAPPDGEAQHPLPNPSPEQARALLQAAAGFVASTLTRQNWQPTDPTLAGLAQQPIFGAFVSLKRGHHLRGCCGFLGQYVPLIQGIQHSAGRTAVDDHRFPPVSLTELPYLDVEVWLLDRAQPVAVEGAGRVAAVTIGRHGLTIARGNQSGLLLPGVAVEHGWEAEQFLDQVCIKAGLPTTAWREPDTRLSTFEGWTSRQPIAELGLNVDGLRMALPVTRADLAPLARHAGQNVFNILRGAASNPYLREIRDGNVCGVVLLVEGVNVGQRVEVSKFDLRPNLALQTTLFELSQAVANALQSRPDLPRWFEQLRIGLTVLGDTAMHGTVADVDVRGIAPAERAVLVLEGQRHALVYDPTRAADVLVSEAVQGAQISRPATAAVQSMAIVSTEPRVVVRQVPQAQMPTADSIPSARPAAQAGRFYPADVRELNQMLDEFWQRPVPARQRWAACMVPHAGLVFSGRLAADVLRSVEISQTVIIIGPKHTPLGVPWAVSPHSRWSIPGCELNNDLELARALVQAIPGLQFDTAAHQQEHGIEVELPLVARLAPQTKVVGITIGGGDLQRCQQFATGLASVLSQLPEQPLLVISSDMNHFATDAENRRLDKLALDAMDRLDPGQLFDVVTRNQISMCGLLPAVMVMETLRRLGGLTRLERRGYATSADVSGDTSRVVGYAGAVMN